MKYLIFSCLFYSAVCSAEAVFNSQEIKLLKSFGPWPMTFSKDPSNRFSGNIEAIKFGQSIFNDVRFSKNSAISCSSCHQEKNNFTDNTATSFGLNKLSRNTPSVLNLNGNRWFSWDGSNDSLWSQSLRPLLNASEMGLTLKSIKTIITSNDDLNKRYLKITGESPLKHDDEAIAVNIAKFLAAYQEQLVSAATPFDEFVKSLSNENMALNALTNNQIKGLKLFIGKGNCTTCHFGNKLSNNEFSDIGIPYFTENGVDKGRYQGIKLLKDSRYNLNSSFNDQLDTIKSPQVRPLQRNFGEFKVPSLRGISSTAPYMHNGSIKTLYGVVEHYSELNEDRLHSDGIQILKALHLNQQEKEDLVSFLNIL